MQAGETFTQGRRRIENIVIHNIVVHHGLGHVDGGTAHGYGMCPQAGKQSPSRKNPFNIAFLNRDGS
jgi:hypothetical protein